ncbi:hypothetical protein [Sphingobium baderi]|uniref:Uncharacterized protein n=1 Tax=Sphingobium baderi LL03 TaxID=1114964 RepID=T0GZU0_9SPHN|nr:hypothetical protein [Sphingobium baderi]EQB06237.1 hypothetical protein L485_01040 [Sphingobium baderi LL03]KMS62746.1 hypothetical protein V475_06515 [Sphingobium baderi LL03]
MNAIPFTLSTLRAHWKLIGAAFLLLALIIQTFRLSATEGALSAEKAGRQADRASYEKAQAQATAEALSAKLKKDAENAQKAEQADSRYADLSQQYRAAVLRYQAAQRQAGSADLSIPAESPESGDGPGGGAVFPVGTILIPENDAFICAHGIARLQAVREWALSLDQP